MRTQIDGGVFEENGVPQSIARASHQRGADRHQPLRQPTGLSDSLHIPFLSRSTSACQSRVSAMFRPGAVQRALRATARSTRSTPTGCRSYVVPASNAVTPIEKILLGTIKATGPVSFGSYMQMCLSHPTEGYYMKTDRPVFGDRGDFTTSPEISQVFGEVRRDTECTVSILDDDLKVARRHLAAVAVVVCWQLEETALG